MTYCTPSPSEEGFTVKGRDLQEFASKNVSLIRKKAKQFGQSCLH